MGFRHVLVLVSLGLALLATACSAPATPPRSSGGYLSGVASPSGAAPVTPGRTARRGGRIEVVGTLRRDSSGSWVIVGAVPAQAAQGSVIAVVINPSSIAQGKPDRLAGEYVRLTGTAANGIATDSSSLGVIADTIATVTAR